MTYYSANSPDVSSVRLPWPRRLINSAHRSMSFLQADVPMLLCRPGLRYGPSPIKHEKTDRRTAFDRLVSRCLTFYKRTQYTQEKSSKWLDELAQGTNQITAQSVAQRTAHRITLAQRLREGSLSAKLLDEALAHSCVAVQSTRQLIPRANQRLAARAMLQGHFVEMATGEGKTISIAMAAGAAALSGTPVHVFTSNDYLASRDASYLEPVYAFLGLKVSSVTNSLNESQRRQAYTADVVYVTAKQVAFDCLNDSQQCGLGLESLAARLSVLINTSPRTVKPPMLRGLCFALVDEADSLLVDEARIPLVLATAKDQGSVAVTESVVAIGLAEQLREEIDYRVLSKKQPINLTDTGRSELARISENVDHLWQSSRYREERVQQALTVLHSFQRDRDYIIREGCVELLDVHTGRALPDRRLSHGLHRLLEVKENCTPTAEQETLSSLPFQHFFRRYMGLAGISGTLNEVRGEIHHIYDCKVVRVPSHCLSRRIDLPTRIFSDRSAQLQALIDDVQQRQQKGQPTLICTRSVEQSLGVSAMLKANKLQHNTLNAYQDAEESAIVANAGLGGQITVATNMAGRGTDIPLGNNVSKLGGLHIISLAFNDARRLDRQLAGRAARQGDPGSYQRYLCLDDPYLIDAMPLLLHKPAKTLISHGWQLPVRLFIDVAQRRIEGRHRQERLALYRSRETLDRRLAFGGQQEKGL